MSPAERAIRAASLAYTGTASALGSTDPSACDEAGMRALAASLERAKEEWRKAATQARYVVTRGANGGGSVDLPGGRRWLNNGSDGAAQAMARRLGAPVLALTVEDVVAWRAARSEAWPRGEVAA